MEKKWVEPGIAALDLEDTQNSLQPDREEDGAYGEIFSGTHVVGADGKPAGTICDLCGS